LTPPPPPEPEPRHLAGKRAQGRGRRAGVGDPSWENSAPPAEGAVAIGPTTPALEPIQPEKPRVETRARRVTLAPVTFSALEEKKPSRAPVYAAAVVLIVIVGGGLAVLSSRDGAPPPAQEEAPPETAKAEPPKQPEKPAAVEHAVAAAPPPVKKGAEPESRHTMRDRVRAVKDRVDRALEDRRRKREEALASARAARRVIEPKPVEPRAAAETDAFAGQTIRAATPAAAGAIGGAGDDFTCPAGMQIVPGGSVAVGTDQGDDLRNISDEPVGRVELKPYCVDQYEFPNQPGKLPKVAATWIEADAQCRSAGKRLCTEEEWENACRGPQNLRFPYGAKYDPEACNTADAMDNARQTTVAGAFSRCKSGYGVWDLSGNAAEWTASLFDGAGADKTVKGGHSARPGFDDRCASRRKLAPGQHSINVGFRCCADGR